jgi:hypothetical protein
MASALQKLKADVALAGYGAWREACTGVREAYRAWDDALRDDAGVVFGAYLAALDREERAAQTYARLITGIEPLDALGSDAVSVPGLLPGERVSDDCHPH